MKKELVYNLLLAALLTFTSTLMLMHIFIQVSEMLVSPIEPRFIEMCHSLFAAWNTRPPPFPPSDIVVLWFCVVKRVWSYWNIFTIHM